MPAARAAPICCCRSSRGDPRLLCGGGGVVAREPLGPIARITSASGSGSGSRVEGSRQNGSRPPSFVLSAATRRLRSRSARLLSHASGSSSPFAAELTGEYRGSPLIPPPQGEGGAVSAASGGGSSSKLTGKYRASPSGSFLSTEIPPAGSPSLRSGDPPSPAARRRDAPSELTEGNTLRPPRYTPTSQDRPGMDP